MLHSFYTVQKNLVYSKEITNTLLAIIRFWQYYEYAFDSKHKLVASSDKG